jgi:hypothetical protein
MDDCTYYHTPEKRAGEVLYRRTQRFSPPTIGGGLKKVGTSVKRRCGRVPGVAGDDGCIGYNMKNDHIRRMTKVSWR